MGLQRTAPQRLTLVASLDPEASESPEIVRLRTELFEIRKALREIIDSAEALERTIEPTELYQLAGVPLTLGVPPQDRHFCKTCKKLKREATRSVSVTIVGPTPVCDCPNVTAALFCEAFEKTGSRCTRLATKAHRNNTNLVCGKHRDESIVPPTIPARAVGSGS